jgi:hypothetical protein
MELWIGWLWLQLLEILGRKRRKMMKTEEWIGENEGTLAVL